MYKIDLKSRYNYKNIVIGLTGNIGAGKSLCLNYFRRRGFWCLNADEIVDEQYKLKTKFYCEVLKIFGNKVLNTDGNINKKKVLEMIKNDDKLMENLNFLTKKIIVPKILTRINQATKIYRFCMVEAPLLFEFDMQKYFDFVILIKTNQELVKHRLIKYRNVNMTDFEYFKSKQLFFDDKNKSNLANFVVYNNTNQNVFLKKIYSLEQSLKKYV